jgi:hypothetical protein
MGAHPYQYVVPYRDDVQAALDALRRGVFERGEYKGAEGRPRTPEQALELAGDSGTRSILDIERVAQKPDYCRAAPLTPEETQRYFGTGEPTVAMVEECDALWEDLERGMARYIVAYEQGEPKHLVFIGYSFD